MDSNNIQYHKSKEIQSKKHLPCHYSSTQSLSIIDTLLGEYCNCFFSCIDIIHHYDYVDYNYLYLSEQYPMNKVLIWSILSLWAIAFSFAADTCQGNICINGSGAIYMQNNDTIYNELVSGLSGATTTGTTTTWSVNTGTNLTGTTTTGATTTWSIFKPTGSNTAGASQLDEAILRWYTNGLTMYTTITDFNGNNALLREDASKLIYQAARTLWYKGTTFNECTFSDLTTVSDSLKQNIAEICKAGGLMKGDKGEFFPFRKLNNAEAITLIARIAGIKDTTTSSARWTAYLNYVKKLGILNGTDIHEGTMEKTITRWDLIILLHRLGKVYDKYYGDFSQAIDNPANLPTGTSNSSVSIGAGIVDTPRFTNSLLWMYNNDMTMFWKASDYDPYNVLTKEQAAKILSTYRKKFITTTKEKVVCKYTDIANSNLKTYIDDVCNYGIFPNTTTFDPGYNITKVEFVRAILAMQWLSTSDSTTQTVIEKALEAELITSSDLTTFDKPITRYEVAIMLHTLYLKNAFIKNLNDNNSIYYVISATSDQNSGATTTQKSFIDITTIDSKDFNNGYISIFNNVYKINKKETINYFPTSYSRYGTISDINTDNVIGTITLAIGQKAWTKVVVEGYIIFQNTAEIFTIMPTNTAPYYTITKIK